GKENHFPALWTRRRQTEDARRSGQEVRRHARADSSVAKYRAVEVAPRAQQEGAPGRRRVAGGSLSWIDILALERGHEVRAVCRHFTTRSWIESINARPIRTSLIITMWSPGVAHLFLRKNMSAAAIALSGPPEKSTRAGYVPQQSASCR